MEAADWLERFGFKHVFRPEKNTAKHRLPIIAMTRLPKSRTHVLETQLGSAIHSRSKKSHGGKKHMTQSQPTQAPTEARSQLEVQAEDVESRAKVCEDTTASLHFMQTATETLSLDAIRAAAADAKKQQSLKLA
eukprot:TRINITY_DN358_c6_g1_i2.p2 TRINITY_DN358_c6_g1~~TRINITY_DN358_c6_g1_i2.p2  ORF type:complete len:134 (-),score=22.01 TRINITY_DN358_c6_g1_i2:12-413(-)